MSNEHRHCVFRKSNGVDEALTSIAQRLGLELGPNRALNIAFLGHTLLMQQPELGGEASVKRGRGRPRSAYKAVADYPMNETQLIDALLSGNGPIPQLPAIPYSNESFPRMTVRALKKRLPSIIKQIIDHKPFKNADVDALRNRLIRQLNAIGRRRAKIARALVAARRVDRSVKTK